MTSRPAFVKATVIVGRKAEVPARAVLSVSPSTAAILGIGMFRRRCDLEVNGTEFSVIVSRSYSTSEKANATPRVRMPLVIRLMTGARLDSIVSIRRTERRSSSKWWSDVKGRVHWPDSWRQAGPLVNVMVLVLGLSLLIIRRFHHLVEFLLRAILRAPTFCFMSTKAYQGDDPLDVVRVHRAAAQALGVTPGTQALLSWRGRTTLVTIVEAFDLSGMDDLVNQIRDVGSVHNVEDGLSKLPQTLVVHVGSRVRAQLGMPPDTIVEIRRSVTSVVSRHLASFVFPLTAAMISVVGLPDNRFRWWIASGVGVPGMVFVLGSSRIPRRSYGLWP